MVTDEQGTWLTASEAAEILTKNSGRPVKSDYLKKIAHLMRTKKMHTRFFLYHEDDIKAYRVESRGTKSAAAKKAKAHKPLQG